MPSKAKKTTSPKKRAVATPQDFKKKARTERELELPSGAAIIARGVGGMTAFLKSGVIPNNLLQIIQDSIAKGTEPDIEAMLQPQGESGEVSAESLAEMLELIDNITVRCWVLPPVAMAPPEGHPRDDEHLYTDEIDDEDKLFVFQWAIGGSADLQRFREEQNAGMDRLRAGEGMEGDAK